MKTTTTIIILLIMALIGLQTNGAIADDDSKATFQTGSVNGIEYIAGGVGDDDKEALESIAKSKYNVKLVFATQSGSYLADIPVEIIGKGSKKLLTVVSSGPLFYVKLPAGTYQIKATNEGMVKIQKVKVGTATQQIVFTWPNSNAVR
ncbi:MAG: hypothetical protein H7843_11745 [Nitrospirota bacterium]